MSITLFVLCLGCISSLNPVHVSDIFTSSITVVPPAFEVRQWCNVLIGWNQGHPPRFGRPFPDQADLMNIDLNNVDGGRETLAFVDALGIKHDKAKVSVERPAVTLQGRQDFLNLLQLLSRDIRPPSMRIGMSSFIGEGMVFANGMSHADAVERTKRDQSHALRVANKFSAFAKRHPQDKYLSGYADLYAMLLRLQWDPDVAKVDRGFLLLEKQYPTHRAVIVMSEWSRILLASLLHSKGVEERFKAFIAKYDKAGWYVVEIAKEVIKPENEHRLDIVNLVTAYFANPVRDPAMIAWP